MSRRRLEGKDVIITGAASGMGLAMATRFAAEGASLTAADWNAQRLEQAVRTIERRRPDVHEPACGAVHARQRRRTSRGT